MKKTLVGLLAVALSLTAMSCDSPLTKVTSDTPASVERETWGSYRRVHFKIYPYESKYKQYRVEEEGITEIEKLWEVHDDTWWHLEGYSHEFAEGYWKVFRDYGLQHLGDKGAYVEYWFDKRSWNHYDHYHWYLVVGNEKIAEYEKVGGFGSAAYDHVRLLRSWWTYTDPEGRHWPW